LKLNGKCERRNYPFLWACYNNKIEIVKLLIEYASKNNIILKLNEINKSGNYILLCVCDKSNIDIVELLIDYANKKQYYFEIE